MTRPTALLLVACALSMGCDFSVTFVPVHEGADIQQNLRPALAENGTVVTMGFSSLKVSSGSGPSTSIDLTPSGLDPALADERAYRRVQVRSTGEIVFIARRPEPTCSSGLMIGTYVRLPSGAITPLVEECRASDTRFDEVAMSPNGTVAVSTAAGLGNSGRPGAIWRGPSTGPLSVLQSAGPVVFNTSWLDVNDAGRTVVQTEYFGPTLVRGNLLFDTPEQPLSALESATERTDVSIQTPVAINGSGVVAFTADTPFTMIIGGMPYTHSAGVYVATPTPIQTPKRLTQIANLDGALCGFGNVDINNAGIVVFEAKLDGEPGCSDPNVYDALYRYGSSVTAFALRSDTSASPLGSHCDYHSVRLGQINSAQQVSFLTISTDAGEPPVKVWRADIVPG